MLFDCATDLFEGREPEAFLLILLSSELVVRYIREKRGMW